MPGVQKKQQDMSNYVSRSDMSRRERAEIVIEVDYMSKLTYFLGGVRGMKSIEAASLCAHFGTLSSVLGASIKAMLGCPGFGQMKACRLHDILIARWQTLGQPA